MFGFYLFLVLAIVASIVYALFDLDVFTIDDFFELFDREND